MAAGITFHGVGADVRARFADWMKSYGLGAFDGDAVEVTKRGAKVALRYDSQSESLNVRVLSAPRGVGSRNYVIHLLHDVLVGCGMNDA